MILEILQVRYHPKHFKDEDATATAVNNALTGESETVLVTTGLGPMVPVQAASEAKY